MSLTIKGNVSYFLLPFGLENIYVTFKFDIGQTNVTFHSLESL